MKRIFVVEDDETIREGISNFLTEHNYRVETAQDGAEALAKLKKNPPDLVILDLGLPKITGETVCQELKKQYPNLPVIMLTAKNHTKEVVYGFSLGADDYITKPFELEELLARIKIKLKTDEETTILLDDLSMDLSAVKVTRAGKEISLSPHEFRLLHYFLLNTGRVLTREMILNRVWQYSYDINSRVVDVYVGYLRKKIDDGFEKKLISSVRGFGYVLKS